MTNYYVYYRIEAGQAGAFRLSVQELFKVIKEKTGIRGRWMRRRDDPSTYMEIYEGVKDEAVFEALLESQCERLGFQQFLAAGTSRRREIFISAGTPA